MTELADRIGAVVATTETELAAAQEQRAGLVLRAHGDDDPKAKEELAELADRIAELEQRLDDARLAAVGVERQARADAEADAAAERLRLEAEEDRLEAALATQIGDAQRVFVTAGEQAAAAVEIGDELAAVRDRLGVSRGRATSSIVGQLFQIRLRDTCPSLSFDQNVRAYERQQLIEEFPIETAEDDTPTSGRTCSVCSHESHAEIAAALDAGEPLRSIEERYGVSRSALSRHRGHAVG